MQNTLLKKEAKKISFERAIFISWYCSIGDCAYCYMSTQKNLISDPNKAKRSAASILAEAYLCKKLGWKIGFLSAGYGSYTQESIAELCKNVCEVYGEKLWLNVGILDKKTIGRLKPYLTGVCGAVETVNPAVRKKTIPSKNLKPIVDMYKICDEYNLKKGATIIIGIGETINDFPLLKNFIIKNKIDKIIFYALNPIKGTIFENSKGPDIDYFIEWIRKTRETFPKIRIVAGHWVNRVNCIHLMLDAGADAITKFPAIKLFNSRFAEKIEQEIKGFGYELQGTFTQSPKINFEDIRRLSLDDKLKEQIIEKAMEYLRVMDKNNVTKHNIYQN